MGSSGIDVDLLTKLVKDAVDKETVALRLEIENLQKEQKKSGDEIEKLKNENNKLQSEIVKVERKLDEVEQYNRKSSLILGGAFPEGREGESPAETRETAKKIIQEKLKVELKGDIVACHRLRNKRRVVVKFQDSDDRDAVYEAKFGQEGEHGEKITVHENLTEKRARMVSLLEEMRKKGDVLNYHTRNGHIMARDNATKRYSRIQPWLTEEEVKHTLHNAALRTNLTHGNLLKSQTLTNIPQGSVARKASNLEDYVVGNSGKTRQTRQTKRSEGAAAGGSS